MELAQSPRFSFLDSTASAHRPRLNSPCSAAPSQRPRFSSRHRHHRSRRHRHHRRRTNRHHRRNRRRIRRRRGAHRPSPRRPTSCRRPQCRSPVRSPRPNRSARPRQPGRSPPRRSPGKPQSPFASHSFHSPEARHPLRPAPGAPLRRRPAPWTVLVDGHLIPSCGADAPTPASQSTVEEVQRFKGAVRGETQRRDAQPGTGTPRPTADQKRQPTPGQRAAISWSTALRIESSRLQIEKRTSQAGASASR